MSLLPSAMKDSDPIPTGLGKKIEPIPKPEVQHGTEVAPGVFDVGGKLETRIEKNEEANQPTTLEQAWSFMHGFRVGQVVRHRMLGGGRSGVVVYVDEAKAEARVQWDFGFMCTSIFQELEVL